MSTEVTPRFDDVIHSPVRLRIAGLLRRITEVEFAAVRDTLDISDATLSKNIKVLVDAGYLAVRKESSPGRADARRLTWIALTPEGRRAVEGHLAELTRIAAG
ncbi:transcriptional regulator [Microbacterium sp.]|uniref:transcriptional regulator n=1 Tax=Microbacterium sp. TaxID=51671 RepID=UPI002898BB84|nr:transcriptional regulator [Microbacterium sp.]